MADISKIKLPDGTIVNIKDGRIPGTAAADSGKILGVNSSGQYTLLQAPLIGTTSDITPTQVYNALVAGRDVSISYYFNDDHGEYSSPTITFNSFNIIDEPSTELYGISPVINMDVPGTFFLKLVGLISDDTWSSSVFQTLDGPDDVYEIVTLSNISQDLSTATADKNSAQIAYAAMAGKIPILYISGNNLSLIAQCTSIYTVSNQAYVEFSYLNQGSALPMPAYVHVVIDDHSNATITYNNGFLTAITSSDVTSALGYTPYNSTNPNSYVDATGAANAAPVQSVNSQTGVVTLSASDVGALPSNTFIPTKTSDLTNDSGFITTETDPTVPSWAKASTKPSYTASEVGALPDTTVIPSKTSDLTNDSGFITGMTILSYGSSTWQDFLSAYNSNQVIYCRASSNSNPASGSQTRLAFMAYVNNATSPTNVEFQYYRSMSSHSATAQGDEVYVYKLTSAGTWTVTVRKASPNIVAGTGLSHSYSNDTVTLSLDGTIPTKTSDLTNDSGFITGVSSSDIITALGYTPYNSTNPNGYVNTAGASAAAPVQSVNGQTGTVVLDAEDVGALPDDTSIPTKISDLTNDQVYDLGTKTLAAGGQISLTSEEQSDILAMWNRGACAISITISGQTYMLLKEQDITYFDIPLHLFSGTWVGFDVNNDPISRKIALAVSTLTNYPIAMYAGVNDVVTVNGYTGMVSLDASDVGALSSDTDIFKVKQSVLSDEEDSWHTLLMGYHTNSDGSSFYPITSNAWAYVHKYFSCQPSTGTIRANVFKGGLNGTISSDTTAVTQTASDNSTKVATTAFVKSQGYLTLSDLPVWDGSVT